MIEPAPIETIAQPPQITDISLGALIESIQYYGVFTVVAAILLYLMVKNWKAFSQGVTDSLTGSVKSAMYQDQIKELQIEKAHLVSELDKVRDKYEVEIGNIRSQYEKEIKDIRDKYELDVESLRNTILELTATTTEKIARLETQLQTKLKSRGQ